MKKIIFLLFFLFGVNVLSGCNLVLENTSDTIIENQSNITKTVLLSSNFGNDTEFGKIDMYFKVQSKDGKFILANGNFDYDGKLRRMYVNNFPTTITNFEVVDFKKGIIFLDTNLGLYKVKYELGMFGTEYHYEKVESVEYDNNSNGLIEQNNDEIIYRNNQISLVLVSDAKLLHTFSYHSSFNYYEGWHITHVMIIDKDNKWILKTYEFSLQDDVVTILNEHNLDIDDEILNYGVIDESSKEENKYFYLYNEHSIFVYDSQCHLITSIYSETSIYGAYYLVEKDNNTIKTYLVYAVKNDKNFELKKSLFSSVELLD